MADGFVPMMVNGDGLALVRARFRDEHGNEVVSLQVLGTDDRGLRTRCVSLDDDDVDGATREFDRLTRDLH